MSTPSASPLPHLLVLLPTLRDRRALQGIDHCVIHYLDDPLFTLPVPAFAFSFVDYIERCHAYLREHPRISGFLCSHDLASLVAGLLCDHYGFVGPSLESVFLCSHKFYSRKLEENPLWHQAITLDDEVAQKEFSRFPCYLKPTSLVLTLLQFRLDNRAEFEHALGILHSELPKLSNAYQNFFAKYIDPIRYPLAHQHGFIIEELVEGASQHCVEGWSDGEGTPQLWAIADYNFFADGRGAVDNYATPSLLDRTQQQRMVDAAFTLAKAHGMRSGFWNVELWIRNNEIIITEINGRSASVWEWLYAGAYGVSLYRAMVQVALNRPPSLTERPAYSLSPRPEGNIGAQFHVLTYEEGEAHTLFDFAAAEEISKTLDLELFVQPDSLVRQTRTSGFWLARFDLYGAPYAELCRQAAEIRERLLR